MTTALLNIAVQSPILACSVCFGDPNSSLTKGLNVGILSLLAVVFVIWIGVGWFFYQLAKKSRAQLSQTV